MLQKPRSEPVARVRRWHKEEKLLKIQATQGSVQCLTTLDVAMELKSAGDGFWRQNVNVH